MAFSVRRRRNNKVYVYYHDKLRGKLVQVPREKTKHLDLTTPLKVDEWVLNWERENGQVVDRIQRKILQETSEISILWKRYQAHRISIRKVGTHRQWKETGDFLNHIVPFFVHIHERKKCHKWHDLIPEFHTHLFKKELSDSSIKSILWTLERFGKFLVFYGHMDFAFVVQIPARQKSKITPLKVRKTPEEILSYVSTNSQDLLHRGIDFRLGILLSYFAALRPSELFALDRSDILTGESAELNTPTLFGFRAIGLGSRLSISISKTMVQDGSANVQMLTKTDKSKGIVNIWNKEASQDIASIVKQMPMGRLFPFSKGWLEKRWAKIVKPSLGVTPHDLRRASGLYLGRYARIPLTLLQEHMRHAEIETTMLYTRLPSVPDKKIVAIQDFDDI